MDGWMDGWMGRAMVVPVYTVKGALHVIHTATSTSYKHIHTGTRIHTHPAHGPRRGAHSPTAGRLAGNYTSEQSVKLQASKVDPSPPTLHIEGVLHICRRVTARVSHPLLFGMSARARPVACTAAVCRLPYLDDRLRTDIYGAEKEKHREAMKHMLLSSHVREQPCANIS